MHNAVRLHWVRQHWVRQHWVRQHGVRQHGVRQHGVRRKRVDRGLTTAEYAVCLIAACSFGTVLFRILNSDDVGQALADLVDRALRMAG